MHEDEGRAAGGVREGCIYIVFEGKMEGIGFIVSFLVGYCT
jgi:hypothetical protein